MISEEAAALLSCAAFSISSLYLTPTIPLISSGWATFFTFAIFRRELWLRVDGVVARLPWPTRIIFVLIVCYSLSRKGKPDPTIQAREDVKEVPDNACEAPPESNLQPLLFPARTTHTRLFPKKHSFSYSYLLVGIPVGRRGTVGSIFAIDLPLVLSLKSIFQRPWFSVEAEDHLERGRKDLGLQGKLRLYLKSQVGKPWVNRRIVLNMDPVGRRHP